MRYVIRSTMPMLFFALLLLPASAARAQVGAYQRDEAVAVRLISGVEGTGARAAIPLGLQIRLAPGWHTYWRSPGEAGFPPRLKWQGSDNLKTATLLYPAPKRYAAYGIETIGYEGDVVLPIGAAVQKPGEALDLHAALDLLVCSNICVPKHFTLALDVPKGPATPSAAAALIDHYRALIPGTAVQSGLSITGLSRTADALTVTVASRAPLQAPDLFVEDNANVFFGAPQVTMAPGRHSASLRVAPDAALPQGVSLVSMPLTLTIVNGDHALGQKIVAPIAAHAAAPIAPARAKLPLGIAVLLALIGGFILNMMPCVLPVLSLKILGVISHGGGEQCIVRHSFLVTAAGILFSYLVLAGATIGLRELGHAVGWGMQFQQPLFLLFLVLLLTFFAANMWDLFAIRLPQWLADNLAGPYHPKLAGDFATGAFATLLATPCTAPFLGTAIGFALASGPLDILVIFAALGCGMALPYLVIALMPHFATSLPHPGAWMVYVRHALGLALGATALWLIWVLAAQISARSAFVILVCMAAIWGLLALRRRHPENYRLAFGIVAFMLLALGVTLSASLAAHAPAAVIEGGWQPFDESAIADDVARGQTVFVDVTADWCLTCKANEKFVLARADIRRRLFHAGVVPMQGDWTNPNAKIAAFLREYGRYGIPFNAVFGPGAPQGIVLPELLTSDSVIEALDKAEKAPQG